ncbi:bacteriocin-like protein [Elizabethkingia ursingii]
MEKLKKLQREDLKKIEGGMKWTKDRGGCLEDRRNFFLLAESMRNMPACCTLRYGC